MLSHPAGPLCFGLAISLLMGCTGAELSPPAANPPSGEIPLKLEDTQAGPLTAGYAAVDITWRAGAKPGQVGTSANVVAIGRLWRQLADLITDGVRLQSRDKPERLLESATSWTLDYLEGRNKALEYDKYSDVYLPSRGIHTHSEVKAMVVESAGEKIAFVRVDLYLMQRHIHRRVAELVSDQTGIPADNILIAATHNHSAADAAHTAAGISTLSETFDARHFTWLTHKISDAIVQADAGRVPVTMGAVHTRLRATQRNIIGPATAEVVPPEGGDPVVVQAGYPRDFFDDDLWVLEWRRVDTGERLAVNFIFGMHPESLEDEHGMLSSDYVGLTEMGLEERWQTAVMMLPGCMGDIEPDDGTNFGTDFWREDFLTLDEQAAVLVDNIAPVLESGPLPTDDVLPHRSDLVVSAAARLLPGPPNPTWASPTPYQLPVTTYIYEDLPLVAVRALSESANLYLQVLQVGGVLLMGSPSEITTDLGRHIRSRVNGVEGDVWQGYQWPDNPDWVDERVNQNFTGGEMGADDGFAMPIVISQANDYQGYMVTRWEFENRHHYRMSMTLFGHMTADYVATRMEGLARELRGEPPLTETWDDPSTLDLELEQQIFDVVSDVDPLVAQFSLGIPAQDPLDMGTQPIGPIFSPTDEMGSPSWAFGWLGNTADTGNPTVRIERQLASGQWTPVIDDTSPHLWLMYEPGGLWKAIWHLVDIPTTGTYRFTVSGVYRGSVAGTSAPDPLWDPEGKNRTYQVTSASFQP